MRPFTEMLHRKLYVLPNVGEHTKANDVPHRDGLRETDHSGAGLAWHTAC
jgi:hypothetical protein